MRHKIAGLILVICLSQQAQAEEPKPLQVFLLAGQSNMVGQGRGDQLPAKFPYIAQVRAAQDRVAKTVPHTKIILTDDISRRSDKTHFDTAGQLEHADGLRKRCLNCSTSRVTNNRPALRNKQSPPFFSDISS